MKYIYSSYYNRRQYIKQSVWAEIMSAVGLVVLLAALIGIAAMSYQPLSV